MMLFCGKSAQVATKRGRLLQKWSKQPRFTFGLTLGNCLKMTGYSLEQEQLSG